MRTRMERLEERCEKLNSALNKVLDDRERLKAEVHYHLVENDKLVNWILGTRDSLTVLQSIYNSPTASTALRVKAAAIAIAYERPRPAPGVMDFYEQVRRARLASNARLVEEAKQRTKLIEHQPEPPFLNGDTGRRDN